MCRLAALALLALMLAGCTAATAREPERPKRFEVTYSEGGRRYVRDRWTGLCWYEVSEWYGAAGAGGPATAPASACEAQQR